MINTIVVATDGSETAMRAVEFSTNLAKKFDAKIEIISVIQYSTVAYHDGSQIFYASMTDSLTKLASDNLSKAANVVEVEGVSFDTHMFKGDARFVLVNEVIENFHPDLIVMGKTGTTVLTRMFIGSTARYVSERADTNVLLVK
ncbi:universal stress protein [Leuconostoc suionicum]|uniref:universal stress protein n=1 Tax=Leuconostoc suionicum TaxID=1511761 RepID=UPI00233EFED7|nr:universal stress protein [Leuconostoc suionicum]MDC2805372.1 universal stress protein [Leuconostoc suionicum]MDC2822884.1 universal stress protein [Leuconostoc suionicum]